MLRGATAGIADGWNGVDRDDDPPLLVLDESPDEEDFDDEPEEELEDLLDSLESLDFESFDPLDALDADDEAGVPACNRFSAGGVLDDESPPLIIFLIFEDVLVLLSELASGFAAASTAAWSPLVGLIWSLPSPR